MYKLAEILILFFCLSSCTLNILQTDTHGFADDVGDATTEQQVDPNVSVPLPISLREEEEVLDETRVC